jgi:dihydrolipoamide dehydrogenase
MTNILEIRIPDIGGANDVNVAEIYVKVGDKINIDDNLLMLETDKATMEVPSVFTGIITEILVKVGDKVNEGNIVFKINSNENNKVDSINNKISVDNNINELQNMYEVVVIGAGPGGYTAAFRAADLGLKVALIEKYDNLGGVCLNVGCIPSKALLHVAKVINEVDELNHLGVISNKINYNLEKIRDYKNNVVNKLTGGLNSLAKQRKVTIIKGEAKLIDKNSLYVDNELVTFKNLIIAVGSESFKVPGFPYDDDRIISSTGALKLKDVPKKMLVVGGGIIGLEMAEVYSTLGTEITIVEIGDSLIPSADKDLVKILESRIKKRYKGIYLNTKCEKVEAKSEGIYVKFKGNNNDEDIFDKVLIAAGRRPNGDKIDVQKIGVIIDDKGFILVNNQCKTNVNNIYAIGDVVGQPMLAHKATHEARVAAENCAGLKSYFDARTIPSVAYTDPEIAWMGVTEKEAKSKNIEVEIGKFPWAASGRALGNGRDDGLTKIITDKKTHKIIGAGIVGVNAGELLAETVLALEMDCDIHDVAKTIHAHPTLSETIAFGCEMIDGSITDLYVPKK